MKLASVLAAFAVSAVLFVPSLAAALIAASFVHPIATACTSAPLVRVLAGMLSSAAVSSIFLSPFVRLTTRIWPRKGFNRRRIGCLTITAFIGSSCTIVFYKDALAPGSLSDVDPMIVVISGTYFALCGM